MDENKEQEKAVQESAEPVEEVKDEEIVEEGGEEKTEEEVVDDRPAINYKKELERKNRELEKYRAELEAEKSRQVKRYDPNDMTTWSELDLKAVKNNPDPQYARLREQAEEILMDRRIEKMRSQEIAKEKRVRSELELRKYYPEALDPASTFAARMEEVMLELDLGTSPAGRLAAAKIVAAEEHGAKAKAAARGRKTEQDRIARVKGSVNSGDRPQGEGLLSKKLQDLEKRMAEGDEHAFTEVLKSRLPKLK